MRTTRTGDPARWLGVDLSDRHADGQKPNAVCGLDPVAGGGLAVRFWTWEWDPGEADPDVAPLLDEVRAARCVLLDGPQGLARAGRDVRACEGAFRTPGRTPDHLPGADVFMGGYLRSSVELFAAFFHAKIRVSPVSMTGGVGEVFPGAFWRDLERFGIGPLPDKRRRDGRAARRAILGALGLAFASVDLPTDDQLDAAVAALTAAAADGGARGLYARARGDGLFRTDDGLLREGPIVELCLQGWRATAAREAVEALAAPAPTPAAPARGAGAPGAVDAPVPRPAVEPVVPEAAAVGPAVASWAPSGPSPTVATGPDPAALRRAEALLDLLHGRFVSRRPVVVTYAAAYTLLFPDQARAVSRWSPALAAEVVRAASATGRRDLPGLGPVALDAFVVDSTFQVPGRGHWAVAPYTAADWRACFGVPEVAGPGDLRLEPLPGR